MLKEYGYSQSMDELDDWDVEAIALIESTLQNEEQKKIERMKRKR